jgi:two-component system, response regulator YesN
MLKYPSLKKQLSSNRLLIKLILIIIIPVLCSVLIISIFFSIIFTKQSQADINSSAFLNLSSINATFSNTLNLSQNTAYEIYKSSSIQQVLFSDTYTHEDMYKAALFLKNILLSSSQVYSIDIFINNKKVLDLSKDQSYTDDSEDIIKFQKSTRYWTPKPRQVILKNGDVLNFITTIYAEYGDEEHKSFVVVNADTEDLYNKIDANNIAPDQKIIIADSNGNIILRNNNTLFPSSIKSADFFNISMNSSSNYGALSAQIKGKKYMLNYLNSGSGKYMLFLVNEYNSYFANIINTRDTIIIFCSILIILLIILSAFISYKIFTPINDIFSLIRNLAKKDNLLEAEDKSVPELRYISGAVNQIVKDLNNLQEVNANNFNIVKYNFLRRIFLIKDDIPKEELCNGLLKYGITGEVNNSHQFILFRIDNYKHIISNNSKESIKFQVTSIENIINETFKNDFTCTSNTLELEHIVLTLSFSHEKLPLTLNVLTSYLNMVQNAVGELFSISLTIGISDAFNILSINELRTAYTKTYGLTNNRFIYGLGLIYDSVEETSTKEINSKIKLIRNSIIDCVKRENHEVYQDNINLLFDTIKKYGYKNLHIVFLNLAQEILKISSDISLDIENFIDNDNLDTEFKNLENYNELQSWFNNLYNNINSSLNDVKNGKTQGFIESAISYINNYYCDSNISSSLIAEKLGITPQYFSKIFKQHNKLSFPEYINSMRLEKAKTLLTENPLISINEICQITGYNSPTYFATAFLKKYGVPPSKFSSIQKISG